MFYVQNIEVTGNDRLAEAELLAMSGLQGVNIFWVDTRVVEQALAELPDVASVRVSCSLLADCGIHLVERKPFLVWRQGNAEAWIGEDGVVLPARGDLQDATVLDATGRTALRPGDQVAPELVTAVADLKRLIPEVRLYEYTEDNGLSFQSSHGWRVQLGAGTEIEPKLKALDVLTNHLVDHGIAPTLVDVRFPEAPYYRE
jgi:cell division septal protein FtsQ